MSRLERARLRLSVWGGIGAALKLAAVSTPAFSDPPWDEPIDVPAVLAGIAPNAAIAGMYFLAMAEGAKRRGITLPGLRERYLPFTFYPVSEFAPLLVSGAERFYPDRSLRE